MLWLLVATVASACDVTGTDRSSSRSAAPTVTPAPTLAGALTLKPEQVILPAEQFPLAGYSIDTDEAAGTNRWTRVWSGPGAFSWVRVYVTILGPTVSARDSIASTTCDWTFTPPAQRGAEIAAPVVGDGAKACGYDFTNLAVGSLVYTTGTRNVLVTLGVYRRAATQAAAAAFVASLADYQLWIIDKVAPLSGVALRTAPLVQLPSVAVVTPPPNVRTASPPGPASAVTAAPTLSVVLNSIQCGTKVPNQYEPKGYLVQGFVANLTATGPVGAFILNINAGTLQVLDWTGTNPRERLSADPPATHLISHYALNWPGEMDWTAISLEPPGAVGNIAEPTFHISC